MTILCESDPRIARVLAAAIDGVVRTVPDLAAAVEAVGADPDESLVVLGAAVELDAALGFTTRLRVDRPMTTVVLLRHAPTRFERDLALRAGVHNVVRASDGDLIAHTCRHILRTDLPIRLTRHAPSGGRRGRIVTVFAAKGGCGKTTIATNLAVALHAASGQRVCLVDLDLGFGDVATALNLEPRRTLADVIGRGTVLDDRDLPSLTTTFAPGIDCILAPVGPGDAERVRPELIGSVLNALVTRYDAIVVDTPARFSTPVLTALDRSHHHVLITTPERPALRNLRLTLDTMDLLGYAKASRSVLFNRSDSQVGITAADVEKVVRAPIAAHVPSSRDVPTSINRGVPLMTDSPDHPVSVAIRQFAETHLLAIAASGGAGQQGAAASTADQDQWRRSS